MYLQCILAAGCTAGSQSDARHSVPIKTLLSAPSVIITPLLFQPQSDHNNHMFFRNRLITFFSGFSVIITTYLVLAVNPVKRNPSNGKYKQRTIKGAGALRCQAVYMIIGILLPLQNLVACISRPSLGLRTAAYTLTNYWMQHNFSSLIIGGHGSSARGRIDLIGSGKANEESFGRAIQLL